MNNFTSPAVLAMNLIRYIGDEVSREGRPVEILDGISQALEVADARLISGLIQDLQEKGLIKGRPSLTAR